MLLGSNQWWVSHVPNRKSQADWGAEMLHDRVLRLICESIGNYIGYDAF